MRSMDALSLAPGVNNWLADSGQPRILHVFEHACNLINEHQEVLSIVTPHIGNGPFNLVVPGFDLQPVDRLRAGSLVSVHADQLRLGELTIHTARASLWEPCPGWEKLHQMRYEILYELASFSMLTKKPSLPSTLIDNFSYALASANNPSALKIASRLAGLGPGLTPAGDDFLMGAIYASWIIHPPEIARTLAERLAETACLLTTSLSAAWLRAAGRGEAGYVWHSFFEALAGKQLARAREAADTILAVGETSGADALAGFYGMFVSWAALANREIV